MHDAVTNNDSFAGSLSYSPTVKSWGDNGAVLSGWDEFEVSAFVRVGNSEGQGGAIVLLEDEDNLAWLDEGLA
jgi:hypothetical protein